MGVLVTGFFSVGTCLSPTVSTTRGIGSLRSRMTTFQFGKPPKWETQQAQGRVDLCAAKPVHARPTTHSINATERCDFTTDELMAMCAVRGGAPSRVRRSSPDESEESCL